MESYKIHVYAGCSGEQRFASAGRQTDRQTDGRAWVWRGRVRHLRVSDSRKLTDHSDLVASCRPRRQ